MEPPLLGIQEVKDPVFQSEPTGLISLASHANFEEQPEGDTSHLSSSEQRYLGSISISPLWSLALVSGWWKLIRRKKEENEKQIKTSLNFSILSKACVVFQQIQLLEYPILPSQKSRVAISREPRVVS